MDFTLMEDLWFGEVKDDPAEKKAAESLVSQVAEIHGLRPFPVSAQQLMGLVRSPNYTIDAVEKVIETDPLLAARVMRVVNSAAYALRTRCTSISHAVVLLGAKTLSEIATAMAVLDMVDASSALMERLRYHSVAVGSIGRQLAIQMGKKPAEIFTCGLLHDLGKMLILQAEEGTKTSQGDFPYSQLASDHAEADVLHIHERECFGYDHAVLAGHLIRLWQIPDPVPLVVAKHHQLGQAFQLGEETAVMTSLVCVANLLSYSLEDESTSPDEQIKEVAKSGAASFLNLTAEALEGMWTDLQSAHLESRSILQS
jgi:putative nucleotidyltransferase with HDIG domain